MANVSQLLNTYIENAATRFLKATTAERNQITQDLELLTALEGASLEEVLEERRPELLKDVLHHQTTWGEKA